jgi:hypothetical protein
MKKTLLVGLAIGLVSLAATSVFAGKSATLNIPAQGGVAGQKNVGGAGIVGSSHDLSNVGNLAGSLASATIASGAGPVASDSQSRICVYCHHPHNSMAASTMPGGYSPLWNRELSTKTFAAYDNGGFTSTDKSHGLNAVFTHTTGLSGVSLLCMSCHDGVVAMNAYSVSTGSVKTGTQAQNAITSSAGFSGRGGASDMSNHHPMGFNYANVAAIDNEIAQPTTPMVPTGLTQAGGDFKLVTTGVTIGELLDGTGGTTGQMECVTCHDVHNTQNAPGAERFLWRSNNNSNFCLTCHLK